MRITTVIPAYKPRYLGELLTGLSHQTVRPERIIFSDDSPERSFRSRLSSERLQSAVASMNIEVVDGPQTGAYNNFVHVLKVWGGATELVHMLLDDDVIYPTFYERHLQAHTTMTCNCSISKRWTAMESGQPVGQLDQPPVISAHPHRMIFIDADFAFASTVPYCNNWFGEMSNAVFSHDVSLMFCSADLAGISFEGLGDVGTFLSASLEKPLVFLNEPLSCFRINPGQFTQHPTGATGKMSCLAWIALAIAGKRVGKIRQEQAIQCFQRLQRIVAGRFTGVQDRDMEPFCALIPGLVAGRQDCEDLFVEEWERFLLSFREACLA